MDFTSRIILIALTGAAVSVIRRHFISFYESSLPDDFSEAVISVRTSHCNKKKQKKEVSKEMPDGKVLKMPKDGAVRSEEKQSEK